MRAIFFRGKRKDNGEWVKGYLYIQKDGACEITYYNEVFNIERWTKDVIPETVGQYTGLKDVDGKVIFEGDILQFEYTGDNLGVEGVADVIYCNGAFGVLWGDRKQFVRSNGFANTKITVIGNIHDNPELLKEEIELN